MADKLDAALEAVRRGFSVFPIIENGKSPAIENWQNLATTDESQIRRWWKDRPNCNIGTPTEGRLVLDIDPRKGGLHSFDALTLQYEFPKTLRTKTASGGAHVIYAREQHTSVRNSAGELGPGLDVRADGGLIVLPGSTIDDRKYEWGNDRAPAIAPQEIVTLCRARRPKSVVAGKRLVEEDETALDMAWDWLQDHAPTAELGALKDTTYRVACQLYDYGISEESCRQFLREWGNSHCSPRLEDDTIESTARNALAYRGNAVGSKHPAASGYEPHVIDESKAPWRKAEAQVAEQTEKFRSITAAEGAARALDRRGKYLIKGLIDCEGMSVLYGESGGGKTFMAEDIAYHIAKEGALWCGRKIRHGAVVYLAAEGGAGIYARMAALREHYGPLDNVSFHVIPVSADFVHGKVDLDALLAEIRRIERETGRKVRLVVVDTLSRAMAGGDENSSVDMGIMVKALDYLRVGSKAHVMTVHHTGKDKAKGARGHSLLRAATDTEIEIDNKTLTVTKQRDMEGDLKLRFALKPIRIGIDEDGDAITSCYVEILPELDWPGDQQPLDDTLKPIKAAILTGLLAEYDRKLELVYSQPFRTKFAIECIAVSSPEHAHAHQTKRRTFLRNVNRWMDTMRKSAHLRKDIKGQWFMVDAQNVQKCAT